MRRSHRAVLTTAAASTLAAGAGTALALIPADPAPASAPVVQTLAASADPSALQDAVDRLSGETAALESELAAARRRLDAVRRQATASPAPVAAPAPAVRRAPAPAVHARTGASGGHGEHEHEGHGDD